MRARHRSALLAAAAVAGGALTVRAAVRRFRRDSFDGKVVLITGGTRGLGLALARRFSAEGARLVIVARDEAEVREAERDLGAGGEVLGFTADLTLPSHVDELLEAVDERFGAVDVLVNNAGSIQVGPLEHMTREDFEKAMQIHFWAPLDLTLAVLPEMRRRCSGRIVNISSIGGKIATPHLLPYSASKFALVGLSEGLRAELVKDGIYVTTVCPGLMRTGSTRQARFKGQHEAEHAWFTALAATPGVSIAADRAARRILRACRDGSPEVMVSLPARLASTAHGIFPGLTAEVSAVVDRFLPGAGGIGSDERSGAESGAQWDAAAQRRFNEVR